MTATQAKIHRSLETKSSYSQAAREGAALSGALGVDAQLLAMSAIYLELKAEGRIEEAQAVKAEAIKLYEGSK